MRMYSTSLWTLVLVLVALMTCLEMNFMATLWPVMVWTASGKPGVREGRWPDPRILTLYFSKGALANFFDDGVFAELRWRVEHLIIRGDGHCECGEGEGEMWGRVGRRRGTISRSRCRVGANEMKGKNRVRGCRFPFFY